MSVERWLFGGAIPTVTLQDHLAGFAAQRPWWTVLTGIVYTSHFLAPWLLAAIFYS